MGEKDLSGEAKLNVADFLGGIAQMNRDLRVLDSAFKSGAAAIGNWSQDATGLETRIKSLNEQIKIQEKVVASTEEMVKKMTDAKGADAKATEEMQIKLNLATERLNKMKTELNSSETALKGMQTGSDQAGTGVKKMGEDSDQAGKHMLTLKGLVSGLKTVLSGLGTVASGALGALKATITGMVGVAKTGLLAIAGLGTAAIGAALGVGRLVMSTARQADDLDELSQKTGISTTRLQELAYIGKKSGTDLDTMTGSMSRMIRSMDETKNYASPAANAFRTLGVKVKDAKGNLKDSEQVFYDTITALGKIPDETQRDALSMEIFGKSAQELNPLILTGAAGMATLTDEAHKMGAVMSEEDVKAAANLNDQVDGLKAGLQGSANTLLAALIPGLTGAADTVGGFVQRFARAIVNLREFPAAGKQMMIDLVRDIAQQIPLIVQAGISIIQGLLEAITGALPDMLSVGTQVLNSIVTAITQSLPTLMGAGIQIIMGLITAIGSALPAIFQAGSKIIQGLLSAVNIFLPKLMAMGIKIISNIMNGLIQALPAMISSAQEIINILIQAMVIALPKFLGMAGQIIMMLITGFLPMLPALLKAGMDILLQLIQGITGALPTLIPVFTKVITDIVYILTTNLPALIAAGMQLLNALIVGISGALPVLIPAIVNMMMIIINTLIQNLPLLINAALFLVQALVVGISQALPNLVLYVPQILVAICTALVQSLPMVWEAAKTIILALGVGIANSIKLLDPAYQQIVGSITKFFVNAKNSWNKIGEGMIKGIWDGIVAMKDWLLKKLSTWLDSLVAQAMGSQDQQSPAFGTWMPVGEGMALGIGLGFQNEIDKVQREMARSLNRLTGTGSLGLNLNGAGGQGSSVNNEYYMFYGGVNLSGAAGQSLAGAIQAKRF